ncbi:hypothetical protein FLA_5754 [Filimonas lacunae]|nr:hypothetical protein FLA_5754 [Filimonas lacunae]
MDRRIPFLRHQLKPFIKRTFARSGLLLFILQQGVYLLTKQRCPLCHAVYLRSRKKIIKKAGFKTPLSKK